MSNGEIYVIGVDPDFQGLGLGPQLTLAGLDHLWRTGISEALLYVAGENTAALQHVRAPRVRRAPRRSRLRRRGHRSRWVASPG